MRVTEDQKNTIFAALQNGLGLTSACQGLNISVEKVSAYVRKNPSFRKKCQDYASQGYQLILSAINENAVKKNLRSWTSNKTLLVDFITKINLWGDECKKKDVTPEIIEIALQKYRYPREVATVCSMEENEFWEMVFQDTNMKEYFMANGYI